MPKAATWDLILRKQIKLEHGRDWSISSQLGKAKRTRRHSGCARSSVTLAIPWAATSGSSINAAVALIRQLMDERGLGLAEAHALIGEADSNTATARGINWPRLTEEFLEPRADRRASTLGDLRYCVGNVLKTLQFKPRPRDGRNLMRAYAAQHFAKRPLGGKGRRAHPGDVAAYGLRSNSLRRCCLLETH